MKDTIFQLIFVSIICSSLSFMFYIMGYNSGIHNQREATMKTLVEFDMAHYDVDVKTGETTFVWHIPKRRE